MRIVQRPSANFNDRRQRLDMLVLHYTGMQSAEAALSRLADPQAGVSAHYVVREDGVIAWMVAEDKRAWHAGVSKWEGEDDLNSRSIGIEIVNGGHDFPREDGALPPFPDMQVAAVISLCRAILARHDIPPTRIVGHSDIAPQRKRDPGEHFPWQHLGAHGIGIWPEHAAGTADKAGDAAAIASSLPGERVAQMQAQLSAIGYELAVSGTFDKQTAAVVTAFQRRWWPVGVTGTPDPACLARIGEVAAAYRSARG